MLQFETTIGDLQVLVRPVERGDRHLLQLGFDNLSERSRLFRFLHRRNALTEEELDFLTGASTPDHVAIGALDLATEPPRPIAIARYVRNADAPDTAEIAITVSDRYQGKRVGTTLVAALAWQGAHGGVAAFTALVHHENRKMLRLFESMGATVSPSEGTERTVHMPLHRDVDAYPATRAGETLRRVARLLEQMS